MRLVVTGARFVRRLFLAMPGRAFLATSAFSSALQTYDREGTIGTSNLAGIDRVVLFTKISAEVPTSREPGC